ncbi:PREDICTED: alpha-2-macroglobulin receptor-associated protein [Bactrocera latifrons]|uniref:alpha-2-macroglobulin receptor-associated protein n=1 Tax=Bactrocera latifrons TaxID=174628 RepID=UPI0008DDA71F|nr:PREDICTED: alpha-2-macroglobulin receptor-associated protein [Bactrocera latifrons]
MKIFMHIVLVILLLQMHLAIGDKKQSKKYSREANEQQYNTQKKQHKSKEKPHEGEVKLTTERYDPDFRNLQRPFRMAKLNLVWAKAQNRLTEPKLKSLYMELKIQDKEEIAWKQLSSQHKDKEGIKEAELRQKLVGIMSTYDLLEHFEDTQDKDKVKPYKKFYDPEDSHLNKSAFKDKKLNRLWAKAEVAGFTKEELDSLKEEFQHHQDKVDVYYSLLEDIGSTTGPKHENAVNEDELDIFNMVANDPNENEINTPEMNLKKYESDINKLRDHHHGIKDHYERLERLVSSGPHSQEFVEPKVQGLWRVAQASNFTEKELSSIKYELHHFESRLLKLRNLHAEHAMQKEKYKNEKQKDKSGRFEDMEDHIKKQTRKVEKIQDTIEKTIFRHSEL